MSKEKDTWNEEEWGPLAYREFVECPVCHTPNRFSVEALRGDFPEARMKTKPPAMGSLEFIYDTPLYRIRLAVVVDSCCKCGALITIARSKTKTPLTFKQTGGDMPGMMRGR